MNYAGNIFDELQVAFVHEYIHYLDHKKGVPFKGSSTDDTEYYNAPEEFNAYFQSIAYAIEQGSDPKIEQFVKKNDKKGFIKYVMNSTDYMTPELKKNLNDTYTKKFIKRLDGFFDLLTDEE